MMTGTLHAVALDDPEARQPEVSGSKASELARLRAVGFAVPDGIVFPIGIADAWSEGDPPQWLRERVEAASAALDGPVAVRSSSTWEDGTDRAHAGATTTVLNVRGVDAILAAIRKCLDESADAQASIGAHGGIAILIQRLVLAEHAGVAFTADPLSGQRDVVRIASTPGLGEALVQGEVIGSDVTVRGSNVEGDLAELPHDTAVAVAVLARAVEAASTGPQDIEWAVANGKVYLLQARPITVLPVQVTRPSGNNWQKDTAHYPEPLTPFGWSLISACSDRVRSVFDELGLLIRGLEEEYVGGEIYGRVIPAFGSADSAAKAPPAPILGLAARLVPELRRRTARAKKAFDRGDLQRWVDEWHDRDRTEMARRAQALGSVDMTTMDDAELRTHGQSCMSLAGDGIQIHFRLAMAFMHAVFGLHQLLESELGWSDTEIAPMLAGHSPATRAADEAMDLLRERVRSIPGAASSLRDDPAHPIDALGARDAGLAADVQHWIDEHGWALLNYDAGVPVLAERPRVLTTLLLADPPDIEFAESDVIADRARDALAPDKRRAFDEALQHARAVYPTREDNTIIVGDRPLALLRRWMLEVGSRLEARGHISASTDSSFLLVDELDAALAGRPVDDLRPVITHRRGEHAWVRSNPGPAYLGEQGAPPDISKLPDPLRRMNEPVLWLVGHEYPSPVEVPPGETALAAGVAASPGVAEGPVRVIRSQVDMNRLEPGDVLVCQVTSPAWAPLFSLAVAVVADGGGVLSHAAIAAREHGIPAVLGTGNATQKLRDGQRVRVDGASGLVHAISV